MASVMTSVQSAERGEPSLMGRIVRSRESGVLVALLLLVVALAITRNRTFLTTDNLANLGVQITFTAITGIGVLFVILTGGVDLSLGSTAGLCGYVCAIAVVLTGDPYVGVFTGVLASLLTGVLVGSANGAIVAHVRVTPFIVTLGMLGIARSIIYILGKYVTANHLVEPSKRQQSAIPVTGIPDAFVHALSGKFMGIPVPILVLIVVGAGAHLVLTYTVFGRRLYAIGGNEEATQLSGINVRWVKFFAYVVCSGLCGITGALWVARFNQGALSAGEGHELDAIAAAVIGGTSLMGGVGTVLGVILGACVMGVVSNGLDLLGIPPEPKLGIIGAVIIVAAIVDGVRNRRSRG